MLLLFGRVFGSVFEQMRNHLADPFKVKRHIGNIGGNVELSRMASQDCAGIFHRCSDYVAWLVEGAIQPHHVSVQLRHLRRFANQPVQPVSLLIDHRKQIALLCGIEPIFLLKGGNAGLNTGQRRPKLVSNRIQKADRSFSLSCAALVSPNSSSRASTFRGYPNQTSNGFQGFTGKLLAHNSNAPAGLTPMRSGTYDTGSVFADFAARIRP